jgi:hypothetical protein
MSCATVPIIPRLYKLPLLNVDNKMQKFNMQIDFKKQSFSGMLIVQRRADSEIRIVASTFFGTTLFDFGIKDGQFAVYSCISPLQRHNVIKLFENNFKKLFLPSQNFRKVRLYEEYEERISGRNFGKSIFRIYKPQNDDFEKLTIKHPWIGITINLEKL